MSEDLVGQKVGGYEILDVIGRGGMAIVYRAQQVSMNRVVALKVLPRQFANDDTYLQRFNREVRIISQLEHRNIVPVHDYGQHDGQPYIVMRYMSGGSVDDLLADGPLTIEQMVAIITQIAPALDYAHSKNVLHRDIKPSNVLLDDDGGAYLTDFGIARVMGDTSNLTNITTQGVVGTPSYMSPEQAQGFDIDTRSDIYSMGVMLFEMATGRRPFESDTPYSIAVMQVTQPPPAPRSINPNIAPIIEQVIYKALNKRPQERYRNAAEFAEAVERAAEPVGGRALMSDTQPGGFRVVPRAAEPPHTPPPVYPASSNGTAVPGLRLGRRPNLLLSAVIGGLLGCGLLVLLVIAALVLISSAQRQGGMSAETPNASTLEASAVPPTSFASGDEAVIPTSLPGLETATLAADSTPVRSVLSRLPDAEIVFFALRQNNYDLYRLELMTGNETRLTTDAATDMYAQVSPDGTQLVFASSRDGDFELYRMNVDGSDLIQLTANGVTDRIPAWSPDGRWIIYSSDTRQDGTHDLYQMRPDGSEITLVNSDGRRNSHPRWSADDRYIIFTSGVPTVEETWEVMRLDRRTGDVLQLTNNSVRDSSPTFSPEGDAILYTTGGQGGAAIAEMGLDGSDSTIVYDGPGEEWGQIYTPDRTGLLFTSNTTGQDELYYYDIESDTLLPVTRSSGMYPAWLSYASG